MPQAAELLRGSMHAEGTPPGGVPRLAVIDVGSNTARLVVYEAPDGGMPRAIVARKEAPRMGERVGQGGHLEDEAVERGLAALRRFARTLASLGNPPTIAVATSAVRDASDGGDFVARAIKETRIPLRILSGDDEARYAYLGVASAWELGDDLVCDLGGGSMQVASVRRGAFQSAVSLPLGALRLTEEFLAHDPPKEREVEELRAHVRDFLTEKLPPRPERGEFELHGVGGTIRTLARVSIELRSYPVGRVHGYPLRRRDLEALAELLGEMPADKRRDVHGIGGDRADVIVAGLYTLLELLRATDRGQIRVSGMGIREGLAQEAFGLELPVSSGILVHRSAVTASHLFGFNLARGEAIAERAMELFDLLSPSQKWSPSDRHALRAAALFHDAGISIDLWGHARHSAYLVRNFPIVGLDHRESLLASVTLRQHDGEELPPDAWQALKPVLEKEEVVLGRKLGVVLATAETLDDEGVKFHLSNAGALVLTLSPEGGRELSPKSVGRLRKPLKRAFELDVEIRGTGE